MKNRRVILNDFIFPVHHSIVSKRAVDFDRYAEMSTFYKKEKSQCRYHAGAVVTETAFLLTKASVRIMNHHKSF